MSQLASKVKSDFPIFTNSDLIYLDNASTSQKPQAVLDTINSVYTKSNANVHRALYSLGAKATEEYEESRKKIANFIGADSEKEIIFTSGATESLNLLAYSLSSDLSPEDEILISEMEHHSNIIPWQQLAKRTGAKIKYIPITQNGELDLSESNNLFNSNTKIVSITHVSNVLGTINPIEKISSIAHQCGAIIIIDGAQGAAHKKINVKDLGCDFYAFSGHKMLGPTGSGVLWGKLNLLDQMEPFMSGGEMIDKVTMTSATWNEVPYKFEAGTPNFIQAIGLGAAVEYLESIGMDEITDHEKELTRYALDKLQKIHNIKIHGSGSNRIGVVSFNIENIHPHDLAQFLNEYNIALRVGHHCAQPLLSKLNETATARLSTYLYNDEQDIDKLCTALQEIIGYFK
ncbi:MAG: cysteine desulfurase [Candidatus Marinimicrobia bacterium]|nr:cysteine desulfurase [Candidatus Neomarinimicrobiota bacterium]